MVRVRLGLWVLSLCSVRHAAAQPVSSDSTPPEDAYPLEVTDRPILKPAGMRELGFALGFSTSVETMIDAMGHTTRNQTALGDRVLWNVNWERAYGRMTLFGAIGSEGATVAAEIKLGWRPAVVGAVLNGELGFSKLGLVYDVSQGVYVAHKALLAPRRLSLVTSTSITLSEISWPNLEPPIKGTRVWLRFAVSPTYQVTRRLAVSASTGLFVPMANSTARAFDTSISTSGRVVFAFRDWDIYVYAGLGDVAGVRQPTVGGGAHMRWREP